MYNYERREVKNYDELVLSFLNGSALCQIGIDKKQLSPFLEKASKAEGKDAKMRMLFYHLLYMSEEEDPSSLCMFYLLKEAVLGNDAEACHDLGSIYLRKGKRNASLSFFSKSMRMGFLPSFQGHGRAILQDESLEKEERLTKAQEDFLNCLPLKEEDIDVSIEYIQGLLEGKAVWGEAFVKKMKLAALKEDSLSQFLLASNSVCGFFLKEDYSLAMLYFKRFFADDSKLAGFFLDKAKVRTLSSLTHDLLSNGIEVPLPRLMEMIDVVE